MIALAGAFGADGMDVVIQVPVGDRFADPCSGIVRAFNQAGVSVADKNDVLDFGQVFACHAVRVVKISAANHHRCFYPESDRALTVRNVIGRSSGSSRYRRLPIREQRVVACRTDSCC